MHIVLLGNASSIHIARWANGLAARGCAVDVVSLTPPGEQPYADVGLHVLKARAPSAYISAHYAARKVIRRLRPDIVHAHYASGYGTLARLAGVPYILSVWGSDVGEFPDRSFAHRALIRRNVRRAVAVCSTSEAMAQRLRIVVPDVQSIFLTPFGVDTELFHPRHDWCADINPRLTIGTVRSLRRVYGIDVLIRSFAMVLEELKRTGNPLSERVGLRIIGDGPEANDLAALASELGIAEAVEFAGAVPHEKVPTEMKAFALYVQLSREESFGVAALEAAASGLAVIASSVGGLPEVVHHGATGMLVPSEDPAAAAEQMLLLLQNPDERRRLGNAGRDMVVRKFAWTQSVDTMLALYRGIAADAGY